MYHYTESGLQNVWLKNGYVIHKTPYGGGASIQDVPGLHRAICSVLTKLPKLTGAEFRFLRKELEMSQKALATLLGTSEQNVSLWERRGRVPRTTDRLIKLIYLEKVQKNVKILELIERLNAQDNKEHERLQFEQASNKEWKEAA
jgi:DNA-binding transcriptional regulator YiaG